MVSALCGALLGPVALRLAGVRDRRAVGLVLGCASHGVGTARAFEIGSVTIHDRSAIFGDARPCNLYRIQRVARRESRHCTRRIRLENGLNTPHRLPTRGIDCCTRVHTRPDSHRYHGLVRQ
jgi:hypothetical protein